jgi:predicted GNAT family acetyltransferase
MLRKLEENLAFVWDNHGVRSIATVSAQTNNGVRISSVYTPEEFRRLGYASATVATLGRKDLNSGRKFVTVSVDDSKEYEKLYADLGYRQIGVRESYKSFPGIVLE